MEIPKYAFHRITHQTIKPGMLVVVMSPEAPDDMSQAMIGVVDEEFFDGYESMWYADGRLKCLQDCAVWVKPADDSDHGFFYNYEARLTNLRVLKSSDDDKPASTSIVMSVLTSYHG